MVSFSCARQLTLCLFAASAALWAQGTSSLRGTVTDQTKSVIPDAIVTLTETNTGVIRSAITRGQGTYEFPTLAPGDYKVAIQKPGFATAERIGIKLLVDTPITADVTLEIATNKQTIVSVEESAPEINKVDATVGNAFQEKQVQDLPIQTRNAVQLLSLQPGVTQNGQVMGARSDQNNITLDGVDVNDNQNALSGLNGNNAGGTPAPTATGTSARSPAIGFNSALPVPLDSVQEFRVTVAGEGGLAGHSSGGQVSLVTRGGTNDVHGSAYEYNRNTAYTANDFFSNRIGNPRPQLVRNQFGASLGGPIKKDRIFFFLNYERRLDSSQTLQSQVVPSETLKQGILKFATTGGVQTLSPAQVKQIDPLGAGVNPYVLNYLQQYPVGNNPLNGSADGNLNFTGLLFNAPQKLDFRTYVGRFDWTIDSQAKHVVSFRGTLSNQQYTYTPAQLPGQAAAQDIYGDNRGWSLRYTAMLNPSLVNIASVGLTRIGNQLTGSGLPSLTFGPIGTYNNFNRANIRINPVYNVSDSLTWTKGAHTVTGGINFLFFDNGLSNYSNSFPSYSFSRGILVGLGNDIYPAALAAAVGPNSSQTLKNRTAVTNGMGVLLGLINSETVTYQYQKNGSTLPLGQPQVTDFITRDYEGFVQDSWRVRNNLTVTYGLHYQVSTPPYEASGLQVGSTPGIDQYFANRVYAQANGIPGNQLPNGDRLTYNLNGPANGKSSWYQRDSNNFAPRLSIAYAPNDTTVIRAGAAMLYDSYGNDLVTNFSRLGSVGLSSTIGFPSSYNFTTSPRIGANGALPALTPAPAGGFPYTPPNVTGITGTLYGISPDLVAPYSYVLNFNVSKQLKGGMIVDMGYVGRLSHKSLLQVDTSTPLIYFKDPKSGQTWVQNDSAMRALYNNGAGPSAAQVKANPSMIPLSPFVENMFPALANAYLQGSASANYYYGIFNNNGGSSLDNLHQLDRGSYPNCYTVTGCFTFFAPQSSATPTWFNAGNASYHAFIVTLRRPLSKGFGFDFNYTWSHSIDNASTAASNAAQFGGVLQNAFLPGQSRDSSDYDLRHQINANLIYELPFGKARQFFSSAPTWLNEIIGGWQVSSLIRVQSGLPSTIAGTGVFGVNYWESSLAVPNGAAPSSGSVQTDNTGAPSLFNNVNAANEYQDAYPGQSGSRALVRMPWQRNVDIAVAKNFFLPGTDRFHPTLQLRGEAFNAFNFVNFNTVSLSLANPNTFGQFQTTADPRVLQLALRFSF